MAYIATLKGVMYEGELQLGSSCIQKTIIDGVNLLFLVFFFLFLLAFFFRKRQSYNTTRKNWFILSVSISCLLISIAYSVFGVSKLEEENLAWVGYIVEGIIWFILTVSLLCLYITQRMTQISLSEPLLDKKAKKKTSIYSRFTFSWINPLLCMGYTKPLCLGDIPNLFSEDEANIAYKKFINVWEELGCKSIFKVLTKVYFKENIYIGILALIKTIATGLSPLVLYAFVNYSDEKEKDLYKGILLVASMILVKVVESVSQRHWFFYARRIGMRIRSTLMVAVYQKQLRLSSLGKRRHSTGPVVNYIAVDAYRMGEFLWWFHSGWTYIIQLFLSIGVLLWVVGSGALLSLVPLVVFGFLNVPFAKLLQNCQSQIMVSQDERLRVTSEILNSMEVIDRVTKRDTV